MRISIIGTGYVGLSLSVLLAQKNKVIAIDVIKEKVDLINDKKSPIIDVELESYLSNKKLDLTATTNYDAIIDSDIIIIAVPTNYDPALQYFDTHIVDETLLKISRLSPNSTVVIKSTIPVGYTQKKFEELGLNLLFSPEFLREGKALYDNLYPSRIIAGFPKGLNNGEKYADEFIRVLMTPSLKNNVPTLITNSTEAECIKLFSNTFLAMRVAFFNEVDSFAECKDLSTKDIITGMCYDSRIGDYYNNPSFGYGGYCLPKDTKQLLANYGDIPQSLISSIVESNEIRANFIADRVERKVGKKTSIVGIYKLAMKMSSDNFRESSILKVMRILKSRGHKIIIFEPTLIGEKFNEYEVVNNYVDFEKQSDIIIANRHYSDLKCDKTIYCRDLFNRD